MRIILKLIQIYKSATECRRDYYQHSHVTQDARMTTLQNFTFNFQ